MMPTAGQIKEGDFESWFSEWDKRARRLLSRADATLDAGYLESVRECHLRASTYFKTAESISTAIPAIRAFSRVQGVTKGLRRKRKTHRPHLGAGANSL